MVRNMRAVLKKASWGTRRIFGSIRCKKQAFPVRKRCSVPKTASWGTRRIQRNSVLKIGFSGTEEIFGAKNSFLGYAMHFLRRSVRKTGFYGTEEIFGAKNSLLGYATHLQRPAEQPTPQTVDSLLPHRTHFQRRAVPKAAPAAPNASSVRETAPALFVRSGGPFPCSFDGTRYQKQPPLGGEQT